MYVNVNVNVNKNVHELLAFDNQLQTKSSYACTVVACAHGKKHYVYVTNCVHSIQLESDHCFCGNGIPGARRWGGAYIYIYIYVYMKICRVYTV